MKTKTKNVEPNSSIKHRASAIRRPVESIRLRASLYTFLSFCFLTSPVDAQISPEQLDPTNSLLPYLTEILFDVNIPTVRQMQPAKSYLTTQQQDIRLNSVEALQIGNVDAVSSTTGVNQKLSSTLMLRPEGTHRGFTIPGSQSNHLGRQLWRAGISAYEGEKDRKSKVALKRIIEQIRSIEFARPKKTVEPVIIVEPVVKTVEPNGTLPARGAAGESETETKEPRTYFETTDNAKSRWGVTDRTLQLVGNLAQHPDRSDNPFALGEVLYYSGHLKEAAVFYQEALKRKSSDKAGSDQDRAWILFQMGNCLRGDDPLTAKKMYGLLIAEYSDSPWVDLAKAREGLIDWQQKDKPRTLIAAESQL